MSNSTSKVRIGIYGIDHTRDKVVNRHVALWDVGYVSAIEYDDTAVAVELCPPDGRRSWDDILEEIDGVAFPGFPEGYRGERIFEEDLCHWCRENKMPLLAIDNGLLTLNAAFGGLNYSDLPRECPAALQHRHPPEEDTRHHIEIIPKTRLSRTYGEGEVIVNSHHRRGIQKVARGFRVGGRALDGLVEAIEWEDDDWFAMGIQWQPASPSSSGLDIQVFRALISAAQEAAAARSTIRFARAA